MFKFSKKVDYSVLLITELVQRGDEITSAGSLAEKFGLSADFIANLMKNLSRKGLVRATRGKKGGYSLIIDPENITLKDVIQAVDGPISITGCIESDHSLCKCYNVCGSRVKMMDVSRQINRILEDTNLGEIVRANIDAINSSTVSNTGISQGVLHE